MRKLISAALLATGILVSPLVLADTTTTPPDTNANCRGQGHHGGDFPKGDITREQFLQKMGERFDQMDTNHDGVLTQQEREAWRKQMGDKMRQNRKDCGRNRASAPAAQ